SRADDDGIDDGGHLDGPDDSGPDARGIVALTLEPLDVIVAGAEHDALWGGADAAAQRATRAAARVQGLLGTEAVRRPVPVGGRGPSERVALVPVGEEAPADTGAWPGALPAPSPAVVPRAEADDVPAGAAGLSRVPGVPLRHPAARAELFDADGKAVAVTGRGTLTGEPVTLRWGGRAHPVTAWAGPWPVDERWWTADEARRAAR